MLHIALFIWSYDCQEIMKVSVVMATFNKAEYLRRTLNSIVIQNVPFDYEIIVVDDGSSDDTKQVCKEFPVRYAYLDRPQFLNPGPARNVGYRMAKGDIIINQSDDVEHRTPDAIEKLVGELTPNSCVFASVYNTNASNNSRRSKKTLCAPYYKRPLFFLGSVWKRHLFAVGGNDEYFIRPAYEDRWLAVCLAHLGIKFSFSSNIVGWHHDHPRLDTDYSDSKRVYRHKCKEAAEGRHPWTARTGAWV